MPGSGKSKLAEAITKKFDKAVWLNADAIREKYDDWDFSPEGRTRQAMRMKHLADGVVMAGGIAIADFVCPKQWAREDFDAEFVIWMNTVDSCEYEDTNKLFESPDQEYADITFNHMEELEDYEARVDFVVGLISWL